MTSKAGHNAEDQTTRTRLRALGVSEMGIAQFGCLTAEQQTGIMSLIEQYAPNEDGNLRIPEE